MLRTLGALVAGATICAIGLLSAHAQETKKSEKAEIPGGIEATIKSVDKEKGTVSVLTVDKKTRTFTVTDETTILGARGGKVRSRLSDRRFREGLDITVVANGSTATELHLGIYRREPGESTEKPKTAAKKTLSRQARDAAEIEDAKASTKKVTTKAVAEAATKPLVDQDDDEDNEILGKVKTYDTSSGRHLLVVTLLNGKSRSFFLAKEVKVLVKGKPSKGGLADPSIKEGTPITVLTEAGGRRVKELHLEPPAAPSRKKQSKNAG